MYRDVLGLTQEQVKKKLDSDADAFIGFLARPLRRREEYKTGKWAVYFLLAPRAQTFKIGTTRDLEKRFRSIRNTCSEPIELLGWISGNYNVEQEIHYRFEAFRSHGEWFDLTPVSKDLLTYFGVFL